MLLRLHSTTSSCSPTALHSSTQLMFHEKAQGRVP
jgi:hypothetical protein